jgi:hypothetical protein
MQPNCWARHGQKGALIVAPLVVLPLLLVFVSVARAQAEDHNCADFSSQAEAQAELDSDPSDPNNLDADNDGQACEDFNYDGSEAGSGTARGNQSRDNTARGNQFRDNTATARGAANDQYSREDRVMRQTIPNKGNLANTGGPPLLLAGAVLLSIGVRLSRNVIRRDL